MKDKPLIVLGLAVFAALATFPIYYSLASGKAGPRPKLEMPAGQTRCVEDKAYMTGSHMDLLNGWRDAVVREGKKTHVSRAYGTSHEMSLTRTCLGCHADRAAFCDRCHAYAGVRVFCWNCHVDPKGK